jgi:PAS domain S-box-containing protein
MTDDVSPSENTLRESGKPEYKDARSEAFHAPVSALVLSDDATALQCIAGAFAMSPGGSVTCGNVALAKDLFRQNNPDMVVLDLGSEATGGLDTFRSLRRMDRDVAVVLLAETKDRETAITALEEGAYDLVEKPIDPRLLGFAIKRGIDRVRSARAEQSHRRRLEETIEETTSVIRRKDFLQGILDSSTLVSVVLTDLDQKVLFWNTGAENIFGYAAEEMLGHKVTRIYPPDLMTDETVQELRHMVAGRTGTVHGKMRQITKDGRSVIISLALSPMLDTAGELQGILGVGLDVTEETHLHEELVKSFAQIKVTQDVSVFSLAKLAECRDEETGLHLNRIQGYCRSLASRLARRDRYRGILTEEAIEDLVRSSVLHDIGKVGIPDAILLSENKFTPEDYAIMKRHPIIGGDALAEAVRELGEESYLSVARDIAYHHHERWDGAGYPFGLNGEHIPLAARIVALADVYDALTNRRRYKPAFSHADSVKIIVEGKGAHFDPELVEIFLDVDSEFQAIRSAFSG